MVATRNSLAPVNGNKMPTTPGTKVRQLKTELENKETENQALRDQVNDLTNLLSKIDLVKDMAPEPSNDKPTKKGKKNTAVVPAKTAYKFYCENVPENKQNQAAWKEASQAVRQKYIDLAKADKARYESEMEAHTTEQQALEALREMKKQEAALKLYDAHLEAQKALAEANAGKGKKKKATKDPDAPKRSMSSYMFFVQEMRPSVTEANPDAKTTEIAKLLGAQWQELSAKKKEKFEKKAAQDKERYEAEKAAYEEKAAAVKAEEEEEAARMAEEEKKEALELYANQVPAMTVGGATTDNMSVITDGSGGKAAKKKKDPNAPKRGLTAYNFYVKENRESIKSKMGDKATNAELMTEIGKQWKELNDRQKGKYQKMADKDKVRYEKEMEAYNKTKDM